MSFTTKKSCRAVNADIITMRQLTEAVLYLRAESNYLIIWKTILENFPICWPRMLILTFGQCQENTLCCYCGLKSQLIGVNSSIRVSCRGFTYSITSRYCRHLSSLQLSPIDDHAKPLTWILLHKKSYLDEHFYRHFVAHCAFLADMCSIWYFARIRKHVAKEKQMFFSHFICTVQVTVLAVVLFTRCFKLHWVKLQW